MTFRQRLTIVATAAVAVAVIGASTGAYFATSRALIRQVDRSLFERAVQVRDTFVGHGVDPRTGLYTVPPPRVDLFGTITQIVTSHGEVMMTTTSPSVQLPVAGGHEVAAGTRGTYFATTSIGATRLRMLSVRVGPGWAVQVARPLGEVDRTLARLRWILVAVAFGGVAVAGGLGYAVTRTAVKPLESLTEATEHVARTRDLTQRIEPGGSDEIGRLAESFNAMLTELDSAQRMQRQLIADASHELRTPLTSLRTNIEVLARSPAMAAEERTALLRDVTTQVEELSALVADLVESARGNEAPAVTEDARLDEIVAGVVERARIHWPAITFTVWATPSVVSCVPARIERAVTNLLDNAAKFSPEGSTVEVGVSEGEVRVRDHGSGVPEQDEAKIFDRFYRAPGARRLPGSGLGLAIVRQVAQSHGGTVTMERPADGGSVFVLRIPPLEQPA